MLDITKPVREYRDEYCSTHTIPNGYMYRDVAGVYVFDTPREADSSLVDSMEGVLKDAGEGDAVILSTGRSFENPYDIMAERHDRLACALGNLLLVNQDELLGISEDNPLSYRRYMRQRLFSQFPELNEKNWIIPNSALTDEASLRLFLHQLKTVRRVKLAMLGIGPDGDFANGLFPSPHIGFIEPYTPLNVLAKIVDLDERTRRANSDGDSDSYPARAISHGPASVLKAENIFHLIKGSTKKGNAKRVVLGSFDLGVPATLVQITPKREGAERDNVKFFLDRTAAKLTLETLGIR